MLRTADLLNRGTQEAAHKRAVEVIVAVDSEMPDQFPGAFQNSFSTSEQCTAVETQVHTVSVRHDVAKSVLHRLACEGEADRNSVPVHKRFDCVGRFFQDNFTERKSKACDLGVVRREIREKPAIGWPRHDRQTSTDQGAWCYFRLTAADF